MRQRCVLILAVLVALPAIAGDAMPSRLVTWSDFRDGCVLSGSTTDLAELGVVAVTLQPGETDGQRIGGDRYEELVIVRDGELRVGIAGGRPAVVGPGSVAVSQPGDERVLANAGDGPVSFYRFTFRTHRAPDPGRGRDAGGSFAVDWDDVAFVASDIGGRRQMFDRSTAMFDDFEMHVSTLDAGLINHPAHTHRAEEFVLVVDGNVEMLLGEEWVAAGPGDLVYVESMIPHSLNNTGAGAATYFAFQFLQ